MNAPDTTLLSTHGLNAGYGDFQALFGVDFRIAAGESVALIGANGAGKSTLLKCLVGLLRTEHHMIEFEGASISGLHPHDMVQLGIAMVAEGRRLFAGMTVEENLKVALAHRRRTAGLASRWTLARVYALFPALHAKRHQVVGQLSGGQQQMTAIARALLCNPRILLCDELSLGLSPLAIGDIYAALPVIAGEGTAIVLVEQDVSLAQRSTSRLYCLLEGRVTLAARSADVDRATITQAFFGGSHAVA